MPVPSRKREEKFFERARIALINAKQDKVISAALASYGYDAEKIAEGQKQYDLSKSFWDMNIKEDDEATMASAHYKDKFAMVDTVFTRHRGQAQMFLKRSPDMQVSLGMKGRIPKTYREFFTCVQHFYKAIQANADIQKQLDRIKIDAKVVAACLAEVDELMRLRAEYDRETGESQAATAAKNTSKHDLEEWMDDFDSIAQIALYDEPQRLESLGIHVRS